MDAATTYYDWDGAACRLHRHDNGNVTADVFRGGKGLIAMSAATIEWEGAPISAATYHTMVERETERHRRDTAARFPVITVWAPDPELHHWQYEQVFAAIEHLGAIRKALRPFGVTEAHIAPDTTGYDFSLYAIFAAPPARRVRWNILQAMWKAVDIQPNVNPIQDPNWFSECMECSGFTRLPVAESLVTTLDGMDLDTLQSKTDAKLHRA